MWVEGTRIVRILSTYLKLLGMAIAISYFFSSLAMAKLVDIDAAQQKSIQSYNQRFSDFTQDKNVMGKPQDALGKDAKAKVKVRFDQDDQVAFESDLTYHDYQYETEDEDYNKKNAALKTGDPNKDKTRKLYASVSPHGSIEQGGGSSLLERTVYKLHDKFAKEVTTPERQAELDKKGINYEGVFKVETKEIFNDKPPSPNAKADKEKDKVDRREIREEALPDVIKVGEDSFGTIEKAAKDDDKKNDPQAMGTLSFYYGAAKEGLKALYKSSLGNLGQVRAYKVEGDAGNVKLSEESANCDQWTQQAVGAITSTDPAQRAKEQQEIQKMAQQCKQMVKTSFKQIAPRFEASAGGGAGGGGGTPPPTLQETGPQKEDDRERDYRVELNLLDKEGTRASDVPANWKYTNKDETNKVVTAFDKNGNPTKTENLRMDEQVDRYNDQLKQAAAALPDIQSRLPTLKVTADQINRNQIQHKTKRADEITQYPSQAIVEGFEPDRAKGLGKEKLPINYDDLQKAKP